MLKFVFLGGDNLSHRYKRNLARRLQRAVAEQEILRPNPDADEFVLIGDWTLYYGKEQPRAIFSREDVKRILGLRAIKRW